MNIKSIRTRLPVSYALLSLLTTVVLGSILLLTLQNFYKSQEFNYLNTNAELMAPGLIKVLKDDQANPALQTYIQNLSYLIQARIRLYDNSMNSLADSGSLKAQQFIFTNLTPEGMSAEILREGRADRYFFSASINVFSQLSEESPWSENPVFLAQMPVQPALFGIEPGIQGSQKITRTDQVISIQLLSPDGKELSTLELSEGLAFGGTIIENVAKAWAAASIVAVIIAGLSGWLIARRLTAPLSQLITVTDQMTAGQLSSRAEINTGDEFDSLGQSFNSMAEKLENIIETLRSFVADSAHQLLTPVSALRLNLELAEGGQNYRKFLTEAQAQAFRLQELIDSMLDLSKIEAVQTQYLPVSLTTILKEIDEGYLQIANKKEVFLVTEYLDSKALVLGDRGQITRALENLVDNAIKFSSTGGKVTLSLKETPETCEITVIDQGVGIHQKELPLVFQRFFRGRDSAAYPGSGLGLAIVKAIADRHEAVVKLSSSPDGTTVTLSFPKYLPEG
jgi:signal transduction histidine kinase